MTQQEPGPVHAPEFPPNVTWLQGGPLKLADLRGRPVLLDFWATPGLTVTVAGASRPAGGYGPRSQRP